MSEHLEPLIAAYVAQRQRDFHQSTRGIPTPENRAVWEFDASEKIRAHDREVKAAALREAVEECAAMIIPDALGYKVPAVFVEDLLDRADRIESEARP